MAGAVPYSLRNSKRFPGERPPVRARNIVSCFRGQDNGKLDQGSNKVGGLLTVGVVLGDQLAELAQHLILGSAAEG
jgi:hypothetical protein